MKTMLFDVMLNGRFVMQLRYEYFPAFPIDLDDVLGKVIQKRPTLKGKHIEIYQSDMKVITNR